MTRRDYNIGDEIDGRYVLRRDVGLGGIGRVFEAVHRFTGHSVVIKLVGDGAPSNLREELRARLVREARSLATLRHPNIISIFDGGVLSDGTPFLVMEMLEGRTLEGLIAARGRLTVEDTVGAALQLCDALEAAHVAGIVHRDVKPRNVLVVRDHVGRETVKIVDFGIARVEANDDRLTATGVVLGTGAYMSPEQLLAADDVGPASDVYSLGVTMFECLTGRVPYVGTYQQVLLQLATPDPLPEVASVRPETPGPLSDVVRRAMEPDLAARTGTTSELRQALKRAFVGARRQTSFFGAVRDSSAPPPSGDQRRRIVRAPYVTPAQLVIGEITLDGRTEDISTHGVLFICARACPVDRRGYLRFAMPIEGTIISVRVQVRWVGAARVQDPESPHAVGLEFLDLPSEVVPSLGRYVGLMRTDRM